MVVNKREFEFIIRLFSILTITLMVLIGLPTFGFSKNCSSQHSEFSPLGQLPFHYIIYRNSGTEDQNAAMRRMRVLLDPDAFSEGSLKKLFAALSTGYPKPSLLIIDVITNVKQALPEGVAEHSGDS